MSKNDLIEKLKLEAQIWAQEARTQKGIVMDICQRLGIRLGDWHGATPLIEKFEEMRKGRNE